jgi:hypothetical protein
VTAEIAIINRQAIALAADSAVTIGQDKVWKTANKLFSLGPHHDVAVMIYGSGDYLAFPWEVVIKEFRRQSVDKTFKTVAECAADLIAFLGSATFSRQAAQDVSVIYPMFDFLGAVMRDTADEEPANRAAKAEKLVKKLRQRTQKKEVLFQDLPYLDFATRFKDMIKALVEHALDGNISESLIDEFVGLAYDGFLAKDPSKFASGLVVAGFGADEFFPCLHHYNIDGRFQSWVRAWERDEPTDMNQEGPDQAYIIPFAQKDMSLMFMEGITPNYIAYLSRGISELLAETIEGFVGVHVPEEQRATALASSKKLASSATAKLIERFANHRHERYVSPVMNAVGALPKEEMAAMAEALVDLTSLRRKVDSKLDTVGGPVDVAVISKGDGFIWIKRKFYFKPELNGDFGVRRKRRMGDA